MVNESSCKPDWNQIAKEVNKMNGHGERTGKQCRARWCDQLRPDIKKGGWNKEELDMIKYYYNAFGPKWSAMAQLMKGRTDNDIKNKYYSMLRQAKKQHEKDPSQSLASLMQPKSMPCEKKRQYVHDAAEAASVIAPPETAQPDLPGVGTYSSSSDSDNSAYSYQNGAQLDQTQVLYEGNSIIPQYSMDSWASEVPEASTEPLFEDDDNAIHPFEYEQIPFGDIDFSFP